MQKSVFFCFMVCAALTSACSSDEEESGQDESGNVGLAVMVRNPDSTLGAGRQCPASSGIEWNVGSPGAPSEDARCFVQSNGNFHVDADGTDPQITPPNGVIRVDFEGTAAVGSNVTAAIYTPVTPNLESGDTPCTVTAVEALSAGEVFVIFNCPLLLTPGSADVACQATVTLGLDACGE
jgi:hypothetical protein